MCPERGKKSAQYHKSQAINTNGIEKQVWNLKVEVKGGHHSAPAQANNFVYLIENTHFNNLYVCPYTSKDLARIIC